MMALKLTRVTTATLKVLGVLLTRAWLPRGTHAFALARLSGVHIGSIYAVLARLEKNNWVSGEWEDNPEVGKPQRHLYRLTDDGIIAAQRLLEERGIISSAPGQNSQHNDAQIAYITHYKGGAGR